MNSILKTLGTVVGIPTLCAGLYYGVMASDLYVSEAKFAVRSAKGISGAGGLSALLASPSLPGGSRDSLVVMDYSTSKDMFDALGEQVDLVAHYADETVDPLSRLDTDATQQELLDYLVERVSVTRNATSDVMTVQVRAFAPDVARDVASLVIELNESLINELSNRMEEDAVSSARDEMERAVQRVRSTAHDINRFQADNDSVSPADESAALFGRLSSIEARLSETRATLSETMAYMREDSADVVVLKNRVAALERQLRLEKGRVTGSGGGSGNLGSLIESFQPLVLEQEIAQQQYASSLAAFEVARVDAQRKKQYLITFVEPNLPDAATEPYRVDKTITVMVFAFIAYLIGGLLWSALRDHIGH